MPSPFLLVRARSLPGISPLLSDLIARTCYFFPLVFLCCFCLKDDLYFPYLNGFPALCVYEPCMCLVPIRGQKSA